MLLSYFTRFLIYYYRDLDDNTREIFRAFIVERNIDHTLFRYLLDWLYGKEQKNLFLYYKALSLCFQDFTQDFGYITKIN